MTLRELEARVAQGWEFRVTRLTEEYTLENWRADQSEAVLLLVIQPNGKFRLPFKGDNVKGGDGVRLMSLAPFEAQEAAAS